MTSFYYKARRVKEPILNVTNEQAENYGTSLNALNQAWSSIAATKKELQNVSTKIKQSSVSPVHHYSSDTREVHQPSFPLKNTNIERRVVYENPVCSIYRKENIPPQSYPQPTYHYRNVNEEYLSKQKSINSEVTEYNFTTTQQKSNTSLSGRSLLGKERKSEALKRLKDRINQQRENSISLEAENKFPEKLHHDEDEPVQVFDDEVPPTMIRKVAPAPSAPAYKGFNEPNATFTKISSSVSQPKAVQKAQPKNAKIPPTQKEKNKPKQVKIGKVGKKQRIVAPKKSVNAITTSSWRVGIEIKKQLKKEMSIGKQDETKQIKKIPGIETVTATPASSIPSEQHLTSKSSGMQSNREKHLDSQSNEKMSRSNENSGEMIDAISANSNKEEADNELDITAEEMSSLQENELLSKNAKDVLAEIQVNQISQKEKESTGSDKKKKVKAVIDTGLVKRDKRSPPIKRKLEVDVFPSRKVRHYDQSEVKKYMVKQQTERKRQRLEEKEKKKQQKELQEMKLKELFEKQKAAVKESSKQRRSHMLGSTFTKQNYFQNMRGNKNKEKKVRAVDRIEDSLETKQYFLRKLHEDLEEHSSYQKELSFEPRSQTTTSRPLYSSDDTESNTMQDYSSIHDAAENMKQDAYELAKADRVAAIRATATALRERLNVESMRLTHLVKSKKQPVKEAFSFHQSADTNDTPQDSQRPGDYPGVHNIDSQAALNVKMREMELAAAKIQALYRGHSVRQNLRSWQLSSGRTLYQTLEESRRRAFLSDIRHEEPVKLVSANQPPIKIIDKSPDMKSDSGSRSHRGVPQTSNSGHDAPSSVTTLISEALGHSKSLLEDANQSLSRVSSKKSHVSEHDGRFPSYSSYRESSKQESTTRKTTSPILSPQSDDPNERLRKILEKYKDVPADKYSVINIFTRNYPSLRKQQLVQELSPAGTETENLIADAYLHEKKGEETSIDEYLSEQDIEDTLMQKEDLEATSSSKNSTLTEKQGSEKQTTSTISAQQSSPKTSPKAQQSYRSLLSPKPKRTLSSSSDASEKLFSPTPETSKAKSLEEIGQNNFQVYSTDEASVTSSQHSPALFSDTANEDEINPVLTSTKRSPVKATKHASSTVADGGDHTPRTHNINYNRGDGRMSPNALERRLRAELNLFDSVGDSLQQINEMDKIRDIVQAQQETVSLAQMLKHRQQSYQQDIDKMSLEARERAAKSAQNVEAVKRNAAEAAANAMKAIAEIKMKAADNVAQSTKQLAAVQNEATQLSLNAMKETEQARQHAFRMYDQSVEKRLENVENVVAVAASAVSGNVGDINLSHYRDRLETLRQQSLKKVSQSYTTESSKSSTTEFSSQRLKHSADSSTSGTRESSSRTITEDIPSDKSKQNNSKTSKSYTPRKSHVDEMDDVSEDLPLKTFQTHDDEMEGVSEDLALSEDHELSEALFSAGKKQNTSAPDESIHSNYSEEKFHSSLTEDELKHDFRQVLPSENHRRKSLDHRDYIISGNETSSDELMTPRGVGKSKKHSKSPFVDEDTFTRFTTDMVRQYVQEEEVRAKHQAALLALREKAIVEKTKAEMAYLEMQKKSMKKKGVDEKMPPIAKKQRALMKKLEAEQAEIRRLKEAHKAASDERLFMLQQEQQIRRIQKSTKKIWNEVGNYKDVSKLTSPGFTSNQRTSEVTKADESISEATILDEKLSTAELSVPAASISTAKDDSLISKKNEISEEISKEEKSPTGPSESYSSVKEKTRSSTQKEDSFTENTEKTSEDLSSVSHDLKKLKHMASKKYLTEREKKLESRKQAFSEIMEHESKLTTWRQKIVEEELRLKADIKKVLHRGNFKENESQDHDADVEHNTEHGSSNDSITSTTPHSYKSSKKYSPASTVEKGSSHTHAPDISHQNKSSVEDDASIISEDSELEKDEAMTVKSESIKSDSVKRASSTASKISEVLSYRSDTNKSRTNKLTTAEKSPNNIDSYVYSNTFEELTKSNKYSSLKEKRSEEDSWTEGTSDASDTEQRLKALEHELRRRRTELQKLRKKKEKENLRRKEQQLKKELQAVEQQIHRESKENWPIESSQHTTTKISPRVLSPRSSLDNLILPEKIKIPSEKESRKSLDFSDKESDNEKSISSRETTDVSISHHSSRKDSSRHSFDQESSHKQQSEQDSVGEIKESLTAQDRSDASSVVHEELKTEEEISSVIDELHTSRSTRKSTKSPESIYDDDFFETESVKNDEKLSTIQEDLSKKDDSTSVVDEKISIHSNSSGIQENIHDKSQSIQEETVSTHESSSSTKISNKHSNRSHVSMNSQHTNNKSSRNTAIVDVSQSGQYSSRFESDDDDDKSDKSVTSPRSNNSASSARSNNSASSARSNKSATSNASSRKSPELLKSSLDNSISEQLSPPETLEAIFNDDKEMKQMSEKSPPSSVQDSTVTGSSVTKKSESKHSSNKQSTSSISHSLDKSSTAEIIQPDEFSKSNVSSALGFRLNDRVKVENLMIGTIRFLGKTSFSPVIVAGVELDQPMGTNNGTFQGKQYFRCSDDYGLFTTIEKLKLYKEDTETKNLKSESESSSTVKEVDESLEDNLAKTIEDDGSYSEDFESSSKKSGSSDLPVKQTSVHDEHLSSVSSESLNVVADVISNKELSDKSPPKEVDAFNKEIIEELDLKSTASDSKSAATDPESISVADIPSPKKLDVEPLVDDITDGIMKTIIAETIAVVSPHPTKELSAVKTDDITTTALTSPKQETMSKTADVATKKLLNDALTVMLNVMKEKDKKLLEQEDRLQKRSGGDFFSLLADDDDIENLSPDDNDGFTADMKDVHDQLNLLIGDDDEDEEDEIEKEGPTKKIEVKMKVPFNQKDTRHLVSLALDEIEQHKKDLETLRRLQVPDTILTLSFDGEELDEESTILYKTLIFDVTLHLYCEIKAFGELQTAKRAPWLKVPRKTFSKFVRETHVFGEDLSEKIAHYVCACMGLEEGRPSLTHIKKKLPLNLAKKDYVDAVLVEELREEEALWVNYDEDELRVKFQLADNILDSLLQETVDIINNALDGS